MTNGEILRSEATIPYQQALSKELQYQYPSLTGGSDNSPQLLSAYIQGRIDPFPSCFVSFDTRKLTPEQRSHVLIQALTMARDPDSDAYCRHGDEHVTFLDATDKLIQALGEFNATFRFQAIQVKPGWSKDSFAGQRFIIESPRYHRTGLRPVPSILASELFATVHDLPGKGKVLRRIVRESSDQYGVGKAILVGLYGGMMEHDLMAAIATEDMVKECKQKKIPYITPNRNSDYLLLKKLVETMMVGARDGMHPQFSQVAYTQAVELLQRNNMAPREFYSHPNFAMTPKTDVVFARAVFTGMTEAAQRSAVREFLDPKRTEYIDQHYGLHATTQLITAFLVYPGVRSPRTPHDELVRYGTGRP